MSMHKSSSRRWPQRLAVSAAAIATLASATVAVTPAYAEESGTIGSCFFVPNPTPSNHAECAGADLTPGAGTIEGLNLDYADLSGADLTGSNLISVASSSIGVKLDGANLTGADLSGADLRGSSMAGVALDGATVNDAQLDGVDLSGSTASETSIERSSFDGANLSGIVFSLYAVLNDSSLVGANVAGAVLPGQLDNDDFTGVDFSEYNGGLIDQTFVGANLTDASFEGVTIRALGLHQSDLLRATFKGATYEQDASMLVEESSFVEADFAGVDMTPVDYHGWNNSVFAHANLEGTKLLLGYGNLFSDTNLRGASLFGGASSSAFLNSDMSGATFMYGLKSYDERAAADTSRPVDLRYTQFYNVDLSGANLNNTFMQDTTFYDVDLTGATIQADKLKGLGAQFIDSDLTDVQLPPASNVPGYGADEWLGELFIHNTPIQGTSLVNQDVTSFSKSGAAVPVKFELAEAFRNDEGQLPFGDDYDTDFWHGTHSECDHVSGALFPVGTTTVTCEVVSEQIPAEVLPARSSVPADLVPLDELEYKEYLRDEEVVNVSGIYVAGTADPALGAIDRGTALADLPHVTDSWERVNLDTSGYYRGARMYMTRTGATTVATATFTVTVTADTTALPPAVSGKVVNGVAGAPYPERQLELTGNPTVTLKSGVLPKGLTLSATGLISGTPAAGTGGRYDFTVEATNADGSATASFSLWIIDPAVELDYVSPFNEGDKLGISGEGFTPGGKVEVWLHSKPVKLVTLTADSFGRVATTQAITDAGVHHIELVDVETDAVGVSAEFTVEAPEGSLAYTGMDLAATITTGIVILAAGAALLWLERRRRRAASAIATV